MPCDGTEACDDEGRAGGDRGVDDVRVGVSWRVLSTERGWSETLNAVGSGTAKATWQP